MKNSIVLLLLISCLILSFTYANAQSNLSEFPVKYEELTTPEFIEAVKKSGATCIIPIGVLEKHGPHLPLGTDVIDAREIALRAAKKEYSIVFPFYFFGQIFEAKHQPGTIAYSTDLLWQVLQETCDELRRNGIKNIVLLNGHGGNNHFLRYFCQGQLEKKRDYAVILFEAGWDAETEEKITALRKTTTGGHADEVETSMILSHRPDLVHVDRGSDQSGEDQDRLAGFSSGHAGIWWYAKYPNHYAGDGSQASKEIGDLVISSRANQLAGLIKTLKSDNRIHELQEQFFSESENPLETDQ
ncbi:creatininase family protein [Bacteroidota bacterium]